MKTYFYPALLAPLVMVLTMQSGYADCGVNDRERYDHSFCLDADIDDNNGNFFTQSRWTLDNICTGYSNSLKFKVDLRSAPDKSYTVAGGGSKSGSSGADIRGVYCCTDSAPKIGPNDDNLCEIDTKAEYKEAVRRECQTLIGDPPDECPDNLQQWLQNF